VIVSRWPEGLVLVRQVDHQVQCRLMADAWGNEDFARPEPYGPLAEAARVHDEGWREWEGAPGVDSDGEPIDFTDIDRTVHVALYREGIRAAAEADPRTGLLVSLHGQGLYEGRRGLDGRPVTPREARPPAVRAFLEDQDRVQAELRARIVDGQLAVASAANWHFDDWVDAAYRLLQTWDVMSLHLTWRAQPAGRETVLPRVPRAVGHEGVALTLRPVGPRTATCDPWPFGADAVDLPVLSRTIPDRRYGSDEELGAALEAAPLVAVPYALRPV
jgi:hypothetical protein